MHKEPCAKEAGEAVKLREWEKGRGQLVTKAIRAAGKSGMARGKEIQETRKVAKLRERPRERYEVQHTSLNGLNGQRGNGQGQNQQGQAGGVQT